MVGHGDHAERYQQRLTLYCDSVAIRIAWFLDSLSGRIPGLAGNLFFGPPGQYFLYRRDAESPKPRRENPLRSELRAWPGNTFLMFTRRFLCVSAPLCGELSPLFSTGQRSGRNSYTSTVNVASVRCTGR